MGPSTRVYMCARVCYAVSITGATCATTTAMTQLLHHHKDPLCAQPRGGPAPLSVSLSRSESVAVRGWLPRSARRTEFRSHCRVCEALPFMAGPTPQCGWARGLSARLFKDISRFQLLPPHTQLLWMLTSRFHVSRSLPFCGTSAQEGNRWGTR